MTYAHPEIKKFLGLYVQANSFSLPDGALEQANNVVIAQDGVITKRRGYSIFSEPATGATYNNIFYYQGYLGALYDDRMVWLDSSGNQTTLSLYPGVTVSETNSRIGRSVQANSNFYVTSDNGMLKLEAYNGTVQTSGVPPALDLQARFIAPTGGQGPIGDGSTTGVYGSTQVGWRVTFGRLDSNQNLLESAPSDISGLTLTPLAVTVVGDGSNLTFTTTSALPLTFVTGQQIVVSATDTYDGTYTVTVPTPGGMTFTAASTAGITSGVLTGTGTVATFTSPTALPATLKVGTTVTIVAGPSTGYAGTYPVTSVTGNAFTFASSGSTPNAGGTAYPSFTGEVAYTQTTELEFSVPSEIQDTSYFYRIYRSGQSLSSDSFYNLDFKLIKQLNLTSAQISAGVVFFTDNIIDIFQASAAELYTNPNSQEGELQASTRAPLPQDVAFYKNFTFYANTVSRHTLEIALIGTNSASIGTGDYLEVQLGSLTRRYFFIVGVGNSTVPATAVSGTSTITVTYPNHGFGNGYYVYISNVTGTVPAGIYTISGVTTNTFQFTSTGNSATALDFQGAAQTTGLPIIQLVTDTGAGGIDATARGIVKAINRDQSSLIYANYASSPEDIPGKISFQAKGFGGAFSIRADNSSVGALFSPVLPSSFSSGTQVTSVNDVLPNTIFSSKLGEPEAVPLVNTLPIGSKNKQILRVLALRDCCIVIKEDGIYRIDGDDISNFTSTILDSTVFCLVAQSCALIDNSVMMLSNQGVVKITSSSVQIVSYKIEQLLRPIFGISTLVAQTSAVTYESDRLYLLTTLQPNTTVASTVYCYNTLSDSWSTWDTYFVNGVVGPSDTLYLLTAANVLAKERKLQTRIDYCGQDYPVTVISVASDNLSAVITISVVPESGDIIVLNNVISRIKTVTSVTSNFLVTFYLKTNLVPGSATYYSQYAATVQFAPFHAGQVNRAKQFSQFQVHLRDADISVLSMNFAGDTFGASQTVPWDSVTAGAGQSGWGSSPWGLFDWGLDQGIDLIYTTQPAPIIRVYVPSFAQRSTFIQAMLVHATAGERLEIQEIGYTVRGYGERVSK